MYHGSGRRNTGWADGGGILVLRHAFDFGFLIQRSATADMARKRVREIGGTTFLNLLTAPALPEGDGVHLMASPAEKMLTLTCPGCAGRFRVPVSLSGRRGRCARCGAVLIVAAPAEGGSQHQAAETPAAADVPRYISVECHVCQTVMYGTPDQVGKRFKCPDCGALTVVPPPPKPKVKRPPAALEGEQYEVWGADEQPLPSEILAAQPVYIAVVCRKCQTLMYATEDQVGQTLTCPDCRTPHVVPPPPAPAERKPLLLDEGYAIDPSADPGERPPVFTPEMHRRIYEEEEAAVGGEADTKKGRRRCRKTDARGRPILPRWPLVTGIIPFLFSRGVPMRWCSLSIVLSLIGVFGLAIGTVASSGFAAIAGVCFLVLAAIVGLLWASAVASISITIITESSEGNDQMQEWPPPNPAEWFSYLLYVLIALPVSVVPGWLGERWSVDPAQEMLWIVGSLWLCLPLVMLSQLEVSSPWAIVSGKVLRSYVQRPVSWLVFYVESALLMIGCVAVVLAAAGASVTLLLLSTPVYVAAGLIYCRLLGRLAWCIAETGEPSARG
jgi:hypothetical protein